MEQVIVKVPNERLNFFIDLMEQLHFKISNPNIVAEPDVPEWHKKLVLERRANAKPEDYLDWDDVKATLDKILHISPKPRH